MSLSMYLHYEGGGQAAKKADWRPKHGSDCCGDERQCVGRRCKSACAPPSPLANALQHVEILQAAFHYASLYYTTHAKQSDFHL